MTYEVVPLEKKKSINYQPLESLLSQGKWLEADKEITDLMTQAIGKNPLDCRHSSDLLNIPKDDVSKLIYSGL